VKSTPQGELKVPEASYRKSQRLSKEGAAKSSVGIKERFLNAGDSFSGDVRVHIAFISAVGSFSFDSPLCGFVTM